MMKKYSFLIIKKTFTLLFFLFQFVFLNAEESKKWIVAAQKFSYSGNESLEVKEGISKMIPERILENISHNSFRTIYLDEDNERKLFSLKNEITSLFLQLSSLIQQRDSLVLLNYSEKELKNKIADKEKQIEEINLKINENLDQQKLLNAQILDTEITKTLLRNSSQEPCIEKIEIFNNNFSALYEPPKDLHNLSYEDRVLEKDIVSKGINCLIRGQIKALGEYVSVTVELYNYPGGKKIASVTEYGTLEEADFLSEMIVHKLSSYITNSLPVKIKFYSQTSDEVSIYIDSMLQTNTSDFITIDSGVHHIEFVSKNYVTESLDYYFEGNKIYDIKINLEKKKIADITLLSNLDTDSIFYANGKIFENSIEINGKKVLGQVFTSDKNSVFFIIDSSFVQNDQVYNLNLEIDDKNEYIEKRRRWMYTSYSVLIVSLLPTFYLNGQADSFNSAYSFGYLKTQENLQKAQKWITASNISTGISIGCGAWFIYELIRYLYAANTVLPVQAKKIN